MLRYIIGFVVAGVVAAVICIASVAVLYRYAFAMAEEAAEKAKRELAEDRAQFEALVDKLHDISVAPTNDKLYTITTKGVGVTETTCGSAGAGCGDDVGAVPEAAFDTDLTAAQQQDAFTQLIWIKNKDQVDDLCYRPIPWATAGANCNAKCAGIAATLTCTGAATDGLHLAPGEGVTREYDGTSCICVVGEVAAVLYESERVLR